MLVLAGEKHELSQLHLSTRVLGSTEGIKADLQSEETNTSILLPHYHRTLFPSLRKPTFLPCQTVTARSKEQDPLHLQTEDLVATPNVTQETGRSRTLASRHLRLMNLARLDHRTQPEPWEVQAQ